MVTDVSDDKLTIEFGAVAPRAGYLLRINWAGAHCAHEVGVIDPIGHDVDRLPIRQGVCTMYLR